MTCFKQRRLLVFAAGLVVLGVFVKVASATHSWGGVSLGAPNSAVHPAAREQPIG